jgi:hypothetical protein
VQKHAAVRSSADRDPLTEGPLNFNKGSFPMRGLTNLLFVQGCHSQGWSWPLSHFLYPRAPRIFIYFNVQGNWFRHAFKMLVRNKKPDNNGACLRDLLYLALFPKQGLTKIKSIHIHMYEVSPSHIIRSKHVTLVFTPSHIFFIVVYHE